VAAVAFIEGIARKLIQSSHAALVQFLKSHNLQYSGERQKALDGMLWWGDSPAPKKTRESLSQ